MFAAIHDAENRAIVERLDCPIVDFAQADDHPWRHRIILDNRAIGAEQATWLQAQGYQSGAFVRRSDERWAYEREAGFCDAWPSAITCRAATNPSKTWLTNLPAECGIGCENDDAARHTLAACQHLGLRIPQDIGIVGVDNLPLHCLACDPPLASIETGTRTIANTLLRRELPTFPDNPCPAVKSWHPWALLPAPVPSAH